MVGFNGFFGSDPVIDDMSQHLDESKGIFRKINFSTEERHARAIRLRIGDQLKGVVGSAGATPENPDDQLWIVTDQLGQSLRAIIRDLKEKRASASGNAGQRTDDMIVDEGRNLRFHDSRFDIWIKTSRK
jgi:hypothetical protein